MTTPIYGLEMTWNKVFVAYPKRVNVFVAYAKVCRLKFSWFIVWHLKAFVAYLKALSLLWFIIMSLSFLSLILRHSRFSWLNLR